MIAFDNSDEFLCSPNSATETHAFTCTGDDLILFVFVSQNYDDDKITSVKYDGVDMTRISVLEDRNSIHPISLYYLLNPSTGSNDIVITFSATTTTVVIQAASYTGVNQSMSYSTTDVYGNWVNMVEVESPRTSYINTTTRNCWVIIGALKESAGAFGDETGTVSREKETSFVGSALSDTNSFKPVGQVTMGYNYGGGNKAFHSIMASFSPALVAPGNLKTYNGNNVANIKTINTNPLANVKSLDSNV